MSDRQNIPDLETRMRGVRGLRESNRQLELATIALDELIAMVEADLRHQRRSRLESNSRQLNSQSGEGI
jgi:hypothetical protein